VKKALIVSACIGISFLFASFALADDTYYARCNLKVLKGNNITWVNWQSAPYSIPVGTKLKVTGNGRETVFIREDNGERYQVDLGADSDIALNKFVTKKPVRTGKFPKDVQAGISRGFAKVGMTREQAYMAMCAPSTVSSGRTDRMTLEEIMKYDNWIYSRRRFGKNIGVEFNAATGRVIKTEGIWGKN
jgi:hypothetical protein